MVLILESCGLICVFIVYSSILITNISFLDIVVVPQIIEWKGHGHWLMLCSYEIIVIMIIWSHVKAMTTQPGYVVKGYSKYKRSRLPLKF